ncbi:hypothetical protein GCM10012275_05050 [Longimycelium tulufanense]|uniref:PrsW family intramembrane metalloprotease n=1 Tax=Longimycelium tulufanense TaxID=907463 RepID=A0A8J3CA08_9PSEU|nr:PrsW family intramembrane metalloprotease [Longimycelium tulufanense]GGM36874.1 hypothetical protein GCM10012275_05050 [Longimycelium tulufanense]
MSSPATVPSSSTHAFWHPRRWGLWAYVLLIALGLFTFGFSSLLVPTAIAPGAFWVWLVPNTVLAVVFVLVIRALDAFEKEPGALLVAAFVWGAFAATGLAISANDALLTLIGKVTGPQFVTAWGPALVGPTTEEWLKGLGVIAVLLISAKHVQRPLDGLIYGAMCGLGFQVVENLTYAFNGALENPNSDVEGALGVTLIRFMIGVGSHTLYSGIVGLGLGYAITQTDRSWPPPPPGGGRAVPGRLGCALPVERRGDRPAGHAWRAADAPPQARRGHRVLRAGLPVRRPPGLPVVRRDGPGRAAGRHHRGGGHRTPHAAVTP